MSDMWDNLINEAVAQQDRLDTVIKFFSALPELPGKWRYSATLSHPIYYCSVKGMDDWKEVRDYFGDRIERHRDKPLTVQHSDSAEKVWYFDSVKEEPWELTLSVDPRIEGSECRLVKKGMKEVVEWEVECGTASKDNDC